MGRVVAVLVFFRHGGPWMNVAVFEAVCGFLTVGGLAWDHWQGSGVKSKMS